MKTFGLRNAVALASVAIVGGAAPAQEVYWQVSPFLTLTHPEEWKFTVRLQVDNFNYEPIPSYAHDLTQSVDVDSGTVYFPIVPATSQAQTFLNRIDGELRLNDEIVDDEPKVYVNRGAADEPLPAGTFLAEFSFKQFESVHEMTMTLTTIGRSWETVYNEKEAAKIPWPDEWPAVAQTTFQPELYVDHGPLGPYDLGPLQAKVLEWTNGDPHAQPPAVTAKWLAMKVAESYRPTGHGYSGPVGPSPGTTALTAFGAFTVDGPAYALERGRGSKFNLPLLLAAAYRAAGIPARIVIGYAEEEKGIALNRHTPKPELLRAWVEFALFDSKQKDEKKQLTWVPVDIIELQKRSAWTQDFDRPMKYFGSSDEWDDVVPIAFHFSPYWVPGVSYGRYIFESEEVRRYIMSHYDAPRDAILSAPALWSWNVLPSPPRWAGQWLDFSQDSPMHTTVEPLPEECERGKLPYRP